MPDIGADALKGKEEYIDGHHTFTITTQKRVVARGMMVSLTRVGEKKVEIMSKTTGKEGWDISEGDKVDVYNAYARLY